MQCSQLALNTSTYPHCPKTKHDRVFNETLMFHSRITKPFSHMKFKNVYYGSTVRQLESKMDLKPCHSKCRVQTIWAYSLRIHCAVF